MDESISCYKYSKIVSLIGDAVNIVNFDLCSNICHYIEFMEIMDLLDFPEFPKHDILGNIHIEYRDLRLHHHALQYLDWTKTFCFTENFKNHIKNNLRNIDFDSFFPKFFSYIKNKTLITKKELDMFFKINEYLTKDDVNNMTHIASRIFYIIYTDDGEE